MIKPKTQKTIAIIVIIIIVLFLSSLIFDFKLFPFALEPLRGQVIYEDFNSGIMPCFSTTDTEIANYKDTWVGSKPSWNFDSAFEYAEYKLGQKPKCILIRTYGVCQPMYGSDYLGYTSLPKISGGELYMYAETGGGRCSSIGTTLLTDIDIKNTDISVYFTLDKAQFKLIVGGEVFTSFVDVGKGVVKLTHSFLDPSIMRINIGGREFQKTLAENDKYFSFYAYPSGQLSGNIRIDEIRYSKPNTQCIAKEDEQVQYDDFGPGATIRWVEPRTLSFEPIRFCHNLPVTRRDLTAGGIGAPDIDAELVSSLAEGKSYTVKSNEIITVPYLYKIIAGEEPLCDRKFGEVIVENRCSIYFKENNVKCKENKDCIFIKDCTSRCISNLCVYSSNECKRKALIRQDILSNIKESIEVLPLTENEFRFSFSNELINFFNIGMEPVYHSAFYAGTDEDGRDKYSVRVEAFGKKIVDIGEMNQYVDVKRCNVIGSTKYKMYGTVPTKYNAYCDYVINTEFLTVSGGERFRDFTLNSDGRISVIVSNSLVDFPNVGYEFKCRRITGLQAQLPTIVKDYYYKQGDNIIDIDVDTSQIGQVVCDFTPFIRIFAEREYVFVGKNVYTFTYNVEKLVTTTTIPITTTTTVPTTTTTIPPPPPPKKFPILIVIVLVLSLLFVFYYFKIRRK